MTVLTTEVPITDIVRPLAVLIPLIKQDLEEIEHAGMPYQKAVGLKLIEARDGHFEGRPKAFWAWAKKNFEKNQGTLRTYMAFGIASSDKPFKNLEEYRYTPKSRGGKGEQRTNKPVYRRDYVPEVDAISKAARIEQARLAQQEALGRFEEHKAEVQLARRLVDIGYKVLAKELHPDKVGGDKTAMIRLNRVRNKLKHFI